MNTSDHAAAQPARYHVYSINTRTGERQRLVPTSGHGSVWANLSAATRKADSCGRYDGCYGIVADMAGSIVYSSHDKGYCPYCAPDEPCALHLDTDPYSDELDEGDCRFHLGR